MGSGVGAGVGAGVETGIGSGVDSSVGASVGSGADVGSTVGLAVGFVVGLDVGFVVGLDVGFVVGLGVGEGEADAEGDGEAFSRRDEPGSSTEESQAEKIRMQSIMPSREERKFFIINHSNHIIMYNSNLTLHGAAKNRKQIRISLIITRFFMLSSRFFIAVNSRAERSITALSMGISVTIFEGIADLASKSQDCCFQRLLYLVRAKSPL